MMWKNLYNRSKEITFVLPTFKTLILETGIIYVVESHSNVEVKCLYVWLFFPKFQIFYNLL